MLNILKVQIVLQNKKIKFCKVKIQNADLKFYFKLNIIYYAIIKTNQVLMLSWIKLHLNQ